MFVTILLSIFEICTTIVFAILCSTEFVSDETYIFPSVDNDTLSLNVDEKTIDQEEQPTCSSAPTVILEESQEVTPIIIDLGLFECYYGKPKNSDGATVPNHMLSTVGVRSDFSALDFGNCDQYSKTGFEYKFVMASIQNIEKYFVDFIRNIIKKTDSSNKKIKLLIVGPELDYENEIRNKMIRLLLEIVEVSSVCVTKPSEMAMFALEKKTGIVIHSDGISTSIVPVIDGSSSDYLLRYENPSVNYSKLSKYYLENQTTIRQTVNASSIGIVKLVKELLTDLGSDQEFPETLVSGRSLSFKRMKEWQSIPAISKSEFKPEELIWMGACKFATSKVNNHRWIQSHLKTQ